MAEDLLKVLTRFHHEFVMPDIRRIVAEEIGTSVGLLRDQMLSHFDDLYQRLGCLESEYQALNAAVKRLEERVASIESKLDRMALRSELLELKARVADVEQRITELEADL